MTRNPGLSLAACTLEDLQELSPVTTESLGDCWADPSRLFSCSAYLLQTLAHQHRWVLTCFLQHALIFFVAKSIFLVVPPIIC